MKINELQPKMGKVELEAQVTEKGDVREFNKFGQVGRVCNAKLKDETGEVKLTLWGDQIDQVNVGDTVKIENGYVSEYQGEMQLSTGKFGQLSVTGKSDLSAKEEPKAEKKPSQPEEDFNDEDFMDDEELVE